MCFTIHTLKGSLGEVCKSGQEWGHEEKFLNNVLLS